MNLFVANEVDAEAIDLLGGAQPFDRERDVVEAATGAAVR